MTDHRRPHLPLVFFFLLVLFPVRPAGAAAATPFARGERLAYRISWAFIPAGEAVLAVAPDRPPGGGWHFVMTARTLPAIDLLYRYRERIDSYVTAGLTASIEYRKVQESSHPRDIVVRFDTGEQLARYSNYGQASEPIPIKPGTIDPLAAFYHIRSQPLPAGATLTRWVTDGRELSLGRARVVGREALTVQGVTYQTVVIEPDLEKVSGVFEKKEGAGMTLWITDDVRRLLVKMESKVRVGSFVAELVPEESVIPRADGRGPDL